MIDQQLSTLSFPVPPTECPRLRNPEPATRTHETKRHNPQPHTVMFSAATHRFITAVLPRRTTTRPITSAHNHLQSRNKMKIVHVPCLQDNYAYLVIDEKTREAAAVDPVEPEKVLQVAEENGAVVKMVLTTHHHWDHAGGNEKIRELVPGIKVFGGSLDNVKGCTDKVDNGDKIYLGASLSILSLHTPCHTNGHISYYITDKDESPVVFTGDTLFIAGCGKFFEGTAEQMYKSLCTTLGSLPEPTEVYCGHEFALTVEPENGRIKDKLSWAQQQREAGLPTIPSTIKEEMETNPFMRVVLPEIQAKVGCKSPVDAIREMRRLKDNWRG